MDLLFLYFAEVVMRDFKNCSLEKLRFKPITYRRHTDDIFCIIPVKYFDELINVYNEYKSNTYKAKPKQCLKFLEASIIQNTQYLRTHWYNIEEFSF